MRAVSSHRQLRVPCSPRHKQFQLSPEETLRTTENIEKRVDKQCKSESANIADVFCDTSTWIRFKKSFRFATEICSAGRVQCCSYRSRAALRLKEARKALDKIMYALL